MEKKWWHDKIAYQIYPKSFYDTNGDGIGDIPGIIEKLDYLKELGIDIIWISPCYKSPLADQGYDIADYYQIDERFGTNEDMEQLIQEAKKRDMYILMDLVVNHCSDEHEWFKKACEDPDGEYGKYFYIVDREEGKLPTNWRSYFGGSVWEPLPGHPDKMYFHAFHKKQPDLNWHNPKLKEEIYSMINWWLDRGVAGFRIDAIINIAKPDVFHDYEPDREDGLSVIFHMIEEADSIGDYLSELRERTFLPHDAFTVGEVFNMKDGEEEAFIGEEGYFSSMFDFAPVVCCGSFKGWYDAKEMTPDIYKSCCFETQKRMDGIGLVSNIIENHDEPRGVSRYIPKKDLCDDTKKVLAAFYFFLKGIPFIYQGQEIGMENVAFTDISQIDDINTKDEYQVALNAGLTEEEALHAVAKLSRDNGRTPFHWSSDKEAGFTKGTPWIGVNPNYMRINAESQIQNPDSVLSFYKQLTRLRKDPLYKDTFVYGSLVPLFQDIEGILAYDRKGDHRIWILGNMNNKEQELPISIAPQKVLLNNKIQVIKTTKSITLLPYQVLVLLVE